MHQFRMRPFKSFWGWTKNTSSLAQGFSFFQPLFCPKVFPSYLLPSYLPPPSYLLPTSSHLPHLILRSFHCQNSGELEAKGQKKEGRTRSQKQEGRSGSQKWEVRNGSQKQKGRSGSYDNALEAKAKSEKVEWVLEGKLLPFSSFFFVVFLHGVVVKQVNLLPSPSSLSMFEKKMIVTCYHLLFVVVLQRRKRWWQQLSLPSSMVVL